VIEYVVLGDFTTAVGFLLASTPERTARYYRDALLTLALAVKPRSCPQILMSYLVTQYKFPNIYIHAINAW
jgi:hypothetical protein